MKYRATLAVLATLATPLLPAAQAHAATVFTSRTLNAAGNRDIDATGINNANSIVAALFDLNAGTQTGIIMHKGTITTLPAPYNGSAALYPMAITAKDDVIGYVYNGTTPDLFLWRNGQYDQGALVGLVVGDNLNPPPLPVGLNYKGAVFYTIVHGLSDPTDPIYGRFPHVRKMPYLSRYQTAHSLNANGMLAGTTFTESASAVFVGHGHAFTTLLPPNAKSAQGGFVNDAGEVAGTWLDTAGVQHGFTWTNGTYTVFDLPEAAQAYSAYITGINNAGRVVGYYTNLSTGLPRAFLYNGKTATAFGDYGKQDAITVALNDHGTMVVARQIKQQAGNYRSYHVTCSGAGC